MKKLITTLAVTAVCVGAFAQGKVAFVNDANHYYYMGNVNLLPADAALANQLIPTGGLLPSGKTIVADLYAGTSAGSLFLYSTTTMGATPGRQGTLNVTLNDPDLAGPAVALPGGVAAFFQVQLRDNAYASAALAWAAGSYAGMSSIFTVVPSSTIAFNSIVNAGGTALSTWAIGTQAFPNAVPAGFGSIAVVPEPTTMVLAGLGAASLLAFRRRS